jgi:hypothetical protein
MRNLLAVIFAVTLAACATTKNPVGISNGPQTDTRLLGAWKATDPHTGRASYAFFFPAEGPSNMALIQIEPASEGRHGTFVRYTVVVGKVNEFRFLNLRIVNDAGQAAPPDAYLPVLYHVDANGTLRLFAFDDDAVIRAVHRGEVTGEIRKSILTESSGDTKGESVLITAGPAELDAFMAKHADTLFNRPTPVFHREK